MSGEETTKAEPKERDERSKAVERGEAAIPGEAAKAGRSLAWVFEIPVFYGLMFALQKAAFPEHPGFRDISPNPYWLGVLLFGLRYGLGAGLFSGAASAGLLIYGTYSSGEGFRLEDNDFYFQPGLFMLVGIALGFVADRWEHSRAAFRRRIEDMAGRVRGLQNQIHLQQKAMRAVEQQVVSQMSSVVTLYHGSQELGTLDRSALFPAMLDFFTQALQATKTAIYVRQGAQWGLLSEHGWEGPEDYPRAVAGGVGIIGKAASERRVMSLRDLLVAEDNDTPAVGAKSDAIMAAPLMDPSGEVAAVFAVQAMPFLRFNSASVNLLTLLAEWGGQSIAKAIEVEELKNRSLLDEDYGVHSASYFQNRLRQEFSRSRRYALPLSVLLVAIGLDEVPEARRADALRVLARLLKETTRDIDIVSRTPHDEAPFGVVLATATVDQARLVAERMRADLSKLEYPGKVRVGVGTFRHTMENPEDIVEQARAELR
ncbi:MAG: diguanylate cyclase [Elusimicrobia bacterium]|nr:diguanylate cyclase [Elusimicrobiota bacterium]